MRICKTKKHIEMILRLYRVIRRNSEMLLCTSWEKIRSNTCFQSPDPNTSPSELAHLKTERCRRDDIPKHTQRQSGTVPQPFTGRSQGWKRHGRRISNEIPRHFKVVVYNTLKIGRADLRINRSELEDN